VTVAPDLDPALVVELAREALALDGSGSEPERDCWRVVHRHVHGMLPSEYDIREVPEALYLAVLAARRSLT
jgi:hypothetical protein